MYLSVINMLCISIIKKSDIHTCMYLSVINMLCISIIKKSDIHMYLSQ